MQHSATPKLNFLRTALGLAFILGSFGSLVPGSSFAQQSQTFNTFRSGGAQEFTYIYPTATSQPQTLSFRLNLNDIERGSAEFQPWNQDEARTVAVAATTQAATALDTPQFTLTVAAIPGGMSIRAHGTDPRIANPEFLKQVQTSLQPAYRKAEETYAHNHYYRAIPKGDNALGIMPDHPAIAVRYTAAMGPVAKAIRAQVPGAGAGPRPFIGAALNWLQTIPYDTLENRKTSNGAGFQTPYGLMLGNVGDCDTKATALAALIRAAYPQIPLAIVYVPDHAFLAIGLPQDKDDYALRTEHGTYILADATGPRLTPLGFIDEPTRAKIRTAETDVVPIP